MAHRACSSTAEQRTHNPLVLGSSPSRPNADGRNACTFWGVVGMTTHDAGPWPLKAGTSLTNQSRMDILRAAGLIRLTPDEWPAVKAALLTRGYVWWGGGVVWGQKNLWTPDKQHCVSEHTKDWGHDAASGCYYLDIRVLNDLPHTIS
jgi:hypothetical protein